jgi:hypothetical protein
MSQRERHVAGGVIAAPRPTGLPAGANASRETARAAADCWNDWFATLPESDRQLLTRLVGKDSAIFLDRQPSELATCFDNFRQLMQRIQSTIASPPLPPLPFIDCSEPSDPQLDCFQRDAVSRALHTPDVLLIQGLPGTGKTRTLAELVRQAVARGWRVLLTAPTGAAADAVLERLQGSAKVVAVRCLAAWEDPARLPAGIAHLLRTNQEAELFAQVVRAARWQENELEKQLAEAPRLAAVWARLLELAEEQHRLDHDRDWLRQRRQAVPADVRREADVDASSSENKDLRNAVRDINRTGADRLAVLDAQRIESQKQRAACETAAAATHERLQSLQALETVRKSGRFWSIAYWRTRFHTSLAAQVAEARVALDTAEAELRATAERADAIDADRRQVESEGATERERLIDAEVARRVKQIEAREAQRAARSAEIQSDFVELCCALPAGLSPPASPTAECVHGAQAASIEKLRECAHALRIVRCWREFAEEHEPAVIDRWRDSVNVVAGPFGALVADTWINGDCPEQFDLVIVDEAHLVVESDLPTVVRRARRWVFCGEPPWQLASTSLRPLAARQTTRLKFQPNYDFFASLWERLYHDTWTLEGDRLCCRLHPVGNRRFLENEILADRPDVELRILNPRKGNPVLAEVLFPSRLPLAAAQELLFHELGEAPSPSSTRAGRWENGSDRIAFRVNAGAGAPPDRAISLGQGVLVRLADSPPDSNCRSEIAVEFSRGDGWDRPKAEAWLKRHFLPRDVGRTCRLEVNYRQTPALAGWLSEALPFAARYATERQRPDNAVQFEPVPRRAPAGGRRRGGAGFEIDLGDPRQREMLPTEFVSTLPPHGCVNLPEARAAVEFARRLPLGHSGVITAPYPAQVALIDLMCRGDMRVAFPEELLQRECDVLIISLTRSHVSRAVTYGDDPTILPNLLSRARCRIVFVGDPGTLARRAQWEGAIDHLDAHTGERERHWVEALLRFLPSQTSADRVPERAKV